VHGGCNCKVCQSLLSDWCVTSMHALEFQYVVSDWVCVSACLLICLHTPSPPITSRLLMCGVIVWMSHILKTVSHSHTHLHPHTQLPTTTTTTAQVFTLLRESTVLTWLPHRYRTLHLKQPTTQKILTNKTN
jgi:hypothetical protein